MDLNRLKNHHLSARPPGQITFATLIMTPGFRRPWNPTEIRIEGLEKLPAKGGSFIVMNHTDRYTCWPFQYHLHKEYHRYTTTWVKAKYYQNRAIAWVNDWLNNIPLPSIGYLIAKELEQVIDGHPSHEAYETLKRSIDGVLPDEQLPERISALKTREKEALIGLLKPSQAQGPAQWRKTLLDRFDELMREVVRLNREALDLGLDIIIFPEGTRHKRLGRGFTGAAQMILATGSAVLPVGANGVDRIFPGANPFGRGGGKATFRVGDPLRPGIELKPFEVGTEFIPFTLEARKQEPRFQALTDLLMDRINDLVDPEYQRNPLDAAKKGASRFV